MNKLQIMLSMIILVVVGVVIFNSVLTEKPYYAAPGNNTETCGAPNGTYEQGDWGCPLGLDIPWGSETVFYGGWYNNVTDWMFAICDHEGLGPLHGCWKVANGVSVPVWQVGVFPVDSRLYVTIENNMIVNAQVKSAYEYGN